MIVFFLNLLLIEAWKWLEMALIEKKRLDIEAGKELTKSEFFIILNYVIIGEFIEQLSN